MADRHASGPDRPAPDAPAAPTPDTTAEETEIVDTYTGTDVITTADPERPARRRGPDPLALLVGLATLAMAVFAFVGQLPDLNVDPRWLLAGGAAVVGLVLLVGSLRGRPRGGRGRS